MSKQKIPKSSTSQDKEKRTPIQFWEYRNQNSWRMVPYTMETMETLADHLKSWSKLSDSYRLGDFFPEHDIDEDTFYDMLAKCEKLKAAHKFTIERLASRREIGSLTRKLDSATVFRSLSHYCKIDREQAQLRTEMAAKSKANQEQNETKIVVIERMPSSNLVPEKT